MNAPLVRLGQRALLCACFLAVAAAAPAQQPADTARLSPVTVTATRVPVPVTATAATVTVVTGEELRRRGMTYVQDALRTLAGTAVVRTGSFGGVTALFVRGGESDYVKVLLDGVPLNSPGGAFDFADLTTDDVERIEFVRGPVSVLYGSDAVTGVIQIFTREGAPGVRADVAARAGSYGSRDLSAGVAAGRSALAVSATAARHTSDGIFPFNSAYASTVVTAAARLRPRTGSSARVTVRYTDVESHYPTEFSGTPTDSNQFRTERRLVLGVDAGHFLTDRLEARVQLAATELDGLTDNQPDSPGDTLGFYSHAEGEGVRRAADARVNFHIAAQRVLTVGAEYQHQGERGSGSTTIGSGQPSPAPPFDATRANRGYFAQLLAAVGARLSLMLSARLDDNSAFGQFVTYRVGTAAELPLAMRARASLGTAFREPTFLENFTSAFSVGNPGLEPERTRSWEIGLERSVAGGRGSVAVTYFDQRFRDLIQYELPDPARPTRPDYFNLAAALATGVELEARVRAWPALAAAVQYTYLETEVVDAGNGAFGTFVTGRPLLRRPAHSASLTLDYRLERRGALHATVRRVGRRYDVGFVALPWHTTVDVGAEVALRSRADGGLGVALTARAENVLDEQYEEVRGYPTPGRTVLLGARVDVGR